MPRQHAKKVLWSSFALYFKDCDEIKSIVAAAKAHNCRSPVEVSKAEAVLTIPAAAMGVTWPASCGPPNTCTGAAKAYPLRETGTYHSKPKKPKKGGTTKAAAAEAVKVTTAAAEAPNKDPDKARSKAVQSTTEVRVDEQPTAAPALKSELAEPLGEPLGEPFGELFGELFEELLAPASDSPVLGLVDAFERPPFQFERN